MSETQMDNESTSKDLKNVFGESQTGDSDDERPLMRRISRKGTGFSNTTSEYTNKNRRSKGSKTSSFHMLRTTSKPLRKSSSAMDSINESEGSQMEHVNFNQGSQIFRDRKQTNETGSFSYLEEDTPQFQRKGRFRYQ